MNEKQKKIQRYDMRIEYPKQCIDDDVVIAYPDDNGLWVKYSDIALTAEQKWE